MRGGGYRDPLAALQHAIADKRRALPAPEVFLTALRRALLPPDLVAEIEALGSRTVGRGDTVEALTRIDRALDALASKYESARAELERLGARPAQLEPPDVRNEVGVHLDIAPRQVLLGAALDLGGTTEPWEPAGHVTRFTSLGVPMLLAVRPLSSGLLLGHLRVAVPHGLFPLTVRPQRLRDSMLNALGLAKEVELRVRSFDQDFWIEGDERTARAVLSPDVRGFMRELRSREPVFRIGVSGFAEIVWRWPWLEGRELIPRAAQALIDAIAATTALV